LVSTPSNSREAAKIAKLQSTAERIQKVSELKDKWAKEKEDKIAKHKEKREEERKRQQLSMQLIAEQRRLVLEKQREAAIKKKKAEQELIQSSLEARSQLAKDLEKQKKERRRQSIALNLEILERMKEREAQLKEEQKAVEDFNFECRR
jgi:hypothetical protein